LARQPLFLVLDLYPFVGLFLGLIASDSVTLLQFAYELIPHPSNLFQIVIGQLAPLQLGRSAKPFPFAFYLVSIHTVNSPLL